MSQALAQEGRKRNILVNTIAPMAGSRMTETVLPPELVEQLKPEYVTPLVLKLCDERSEEWGGLYEVGAGWFGKLRWERARGVGLPIGEGISPEDINAAWDKITDFTDATHPRSVGQGMMALMENLQNT
jgi:3-hydroxyacyl-CoA dehydrogenase/3a,7a,12a-trihydroxy-5b-cholest-24-enoyl-CoA hydratase